jgi:thiol-disulfide isomerase/thioredoxin
MKFIKEYKALVIILALIVLFIASLLLTPKSVSYLIQDATVTEWLADAKGDDYTIVTLAQTTCSHCLNFLPTAKKFSEKYDINFYWFDVDTLSQEDYTTLTEQFTNFEGTPYTVVLKSGKIKGEISGEVELSALVTQVTTAGVTLKDRVSE